MDYKLKEEYADALIYVPFGKMTILGKFIDASLLPFMYAKYPDLFEDIKSTNKNDIPIDNTKQNGDSNIEGKNI
jgi:hypothetical protein